MKRTLTKIEYIIVNRKHVRQQKKEYCKVFNPRKRMNSMQEIMRYVR